MARSFRVFVCSLLLCIPSSLVAESGGRTLPAVLRRPVAIIPYRDYFVVGNRASGSLSIVRIDDPVVVNEHFVAQRIADCARSPWNSRLLILDSKAHKILSVDVSNAANIDELQVETVCEFPGGQISPGRIVVAPKSKTAFVTSRWARSVTRFELNNTSTKVQRQKSIQLPFAPNEMAMLGDESVLFVADAFGGKLAVLDLISLTIQRIVNLDAHNIRGLAVTSDGSKLNITHQKLNVRGQADFDGVHWGSLLTNVMRVVQVASLLDGTVDATRDGWVEQHGRTGFAAGDPGPVIVDDRETQAVVLSGTGEVSVTQTSYADRIKVGRRPIDMTIVNRRLYVLNQFDESISVIELENGKLLDTISLGPQAKRNAVDRGEELFFNARVSHDGWMSCNSCHSDGHTSGLLVDTLGDGDYGSPKRIPSLLGTAKTGPWAWVGNAATLKSQIAKSIKTTMHGRQASDNSINDLAAYLQSLKPPPTRFEVDRQLVQRGQAVFEQQGCVKCHRRPLLTSPKVYNVGLTDEGGRNKFNPPSLLGLGQRDDFFHDGRAKSIEEVIFKYKHPSESDLPKGDRDALIAFLKSL